MSRVIVLGAGVVGLSCAVRLLEGGHDVAVLARDLPLETTSAVAGAFWYPHLAGPDDRVRAWAGETYRELATLSLVDGTGVRLRRGTEVLRQDSPVPFWASAVPGFRRTDEVPMGYTAGWTFEAPVVEMPAYLSWLTDRVAALGGTVTRMALSALPDQAEVVVNATGLGGRLFGADGSVTPVRGQVVYVEQVGMDRWWLDSATSTYVVPRENDIVLGGTEETGIWDKSPDPSTTDDIVARATALVPDLRGARVLGQRVGLRPARPTVRLEAVTAASGERVVHCYGHGGSGVTLSWGCADEVAGLVSSSEVRQA